MQQLFFVFTVCFGLSMTAQEVQITWQKEFNVASEMSKSENKPILVYFTKEDCSSCLNFYTDFFKQEAFKSIADNFIFLLIDRSSDVSKTNNIAVMKKRRWAMHYNKGSKFPAVLILNAEAKEMGTIFTETDAASITTYLSFLATLK